MLQHYMGITPYADFSNIEGIEYCVGDTLIGNIRPYLKKVWFATFDGACSADVLALKPNYINPEFLYDIIAQDGFIEYVMSGVKGSKMPRGDKSHILDYETALPSLAEQEKIAYFLRLLSTRIQKLQLLIDSLKKYKRGLLSTIFGKVTNFVHLKDICEYASSAKTMSQIDNTPKGVYPVYDAGGIATFVDFYDMETDYIAIIKDGSGVGRLQFCQAKSTFIGTLGGLIPKNCSTFYLYTALQTIDFKEYVTGMAIPHIYYRDYKDAMLPYPCEKDRAKIQVIFQNLDCKITNAEMLLEKFNEMKKSLLQQLFI